MPHSVGNYTVEGCPPANHYDIAQIGGSIVPGSTDTGNHGDDQTTTIPLPFSYSLYDQTFNSITVSSNGNAQFTTTDAAFTNECLPWASHDYTIFPYWDDQRTDVVGGDRHFHLDFWHCAKPDLQYRMAYCPISTAAAAPTTSCACTRVRHASM